MTREKAKQMRTRQKINYDVNLNSQGQGKTLDQAKKNAVLFLERNAELGVEADNPTVLKFLKEGNVNVRIQDNVAKTAS